MKRLLCPVIPFIANKIEDWYIPVINVDRFYVIQAVY